MTEPLRVGVIGLGIGAAHARAFAAHPSCEVAAVCDRDRARLDEWAALMPAARRYTQADDLIDDPRLDIVVVASQDDDHYRQILRALEARRHVFAEKPLCLQHEQLINIERAWRGSGRRLSTNTILRRSARFRWLREAILAGRLGRVCLIEADYVYGRWEKIVEGWRGGIPDYSVMLGGGIHMVDMVLWLAGERPVDVSAARGDVGSRASGFMGHDLVTAVVRFESGLVARVGANFASVHPHYHGLGVHGTAATFENTPTGDAWLWTSRDPHQPPEPVTAAYPGVSKGDLIPAFVDGVLGRGEPDVTEPEAFAAVSVCLAIDRAAVTRQTEQVQYV